MKLNNFHTQILILVLSLISLSCTSNTQYPNNQLTIGRSVSGRPIDISIHGSGPNKTLLLASIHGSEPAGTPILQKLQKHLRLNPQLLQGNTVIIIPIANPDGYAKKRRYNKNNVDLNRNFPAKNRKSSKKYGKKPLSQPEAKALYDALNTYKPNKVISIHQPVNCLDYDGPGLSLATAMSKVSDLPVEKLGARPGSMGAYVEEFLNIPIITVELSKNAHKLSPDKLWQKYSPMMFVAINFKNENSKQ